MKKIVLILVMAVLLDVVAFAQTPSRDTLPCGVRQPNYFYSEWYDTTDYYLRPDGYNFTSPDCVFDGVGLDYHYRGRTTAEQQFASRSIRIKGLWAMVDQPPYDDYGDWVIIRDTSRLPEFLYLYLRNPDGKPPINYAASGDFLMLVDSVRWDTAQPKMMCLKQFADGRKRNLYCHVYEALFDTVYTVTGEFWIGGSTNSYHWHDSLYGIISIFEHCPTVYIDYSANNMGQIPSLYHRSVSSDNGSEGPWRWTFVYEPWYRQGLSLHYGPFGVILDEQQYYVELPSADTARGIAKPTAYYPSGSHQTITAVANSCYRFSHWSDGDTSNPRTIFVTQDTSFTAYFDTVVAYDVAVRSNDTNLGNAVLAEWWNFQSSDPIILPPGSSPYYRLVNGDTIYCEGDSAIFWARAKPGSYFWYWKDSVRENPRTLTVTQDTLLTAVFKTEVPPEYLRPCPRIDKPRVVVEDTGRVLLAWAWGVSILHERWEVALGRAGMPIDSCEIISCDYFDKVLDTLEVGVRYAAYVRALCNRNGIEHYSDWSDSVEIYFPTNSHNQYTVTVEVNNALRGHVDGGGVYDEGAVAVLTASAERHYSFLRWNDGEEDNPRYVIVTQDTTFTAMFSDWQGIETADSLGVRMRLQPNPASSSVFCILDGERFSGGMLTVTDVSGREMLHKELPPHTYSHTLSLEAYSKGVYFVTLVTTQGSTTQRLVVE